MNDDLHLPPHGRLPNTDRLPCRWCNASTLISTLNQYGARCYHCYEAYVREPQPVPAFMADKRLGDPKAWAHSLKAREESGERLSLAQRTMWREALGLPITGAIPSWEQTPEEYGQPLLTTTGRVKA